MQLYENSKETKESNINKILKTSIIIISIIILVLIILIVILSGNKKDSPSAIIDGVEQNKIFDLIQYEDLGNNQVKLWIPIKEIAPYLGFVAYNGTYKSATEDKNKCYIITEEKVEQENEQINLREVSNFEVNSNIISKLDLTQQGEDYEFIKIEDKVIEKNDNIYTTIEGIEKAFNVSFEYDYEKKKITVYTLPFLVNFYQSQLSEGSYPGYTKLETDINTNVKALLDGILIVKSEKEKDSSKYGAIYAENGKTILETKYDGIKYMPSDSRFLINTNKKIGMISKEGKTLIAPEYDSIKSIDSEKDMYLVKQNNLFGIISGTGKEIIHIENEQIGIDTTDFEKNEIKNGYILLGNLIPVMKNKKWAFYDTSGNSISNFEFDSIGCTAKDSNNTYGLLALTDYNLIVVQKDKKYSFINKKGKTDILPFSFDAMYIKIENGELKYCMKANNKEYSITKTLENIIGKVDNNKTMES